MSLNFLSQSEVFELIREKKNRTLFCVTFAGNHIKIPQHCYFHCGDSKYAAFLDYSLKLSRKQIAQIVQSNYNIPTCECHPTETRTIINRFRLRPPIVNTEFTKHYANNIILKIELVNEHQEIVRVLDTLEERQYPIPELVHEIEQHSATEETRNFSGMLEEFINEIMPFFEGSFKQSRIAMKPEVYFLLLEHVESIMLLLNRCSRFEQRYGLEIKVFYEYLYPRSKHSTARFFVEKGKKPVYYEIFHHESGIMILGDTPSETFSEADDSLKFHELYQNIIFHEPDTPQTEQAQTDSQGYRLKNLTINFFLTQSRTEERTLESLYDQHRSVENETKKLQRIIRRIEQFSSGKDYFRKRYAAFFLPADHLQALVYYLYTLDEDDINELSIYPLKLRDGLCYLVYGLSHLIPKAVVDVYTQEINYTTKCLQVLVPQGKRLRPEMRLFERPDLAESFYKSVTTDSVSLQGIKKGDFFLLLDDEDRYFDHFGLLVSKESRKDMLQFMKDHLVINVYNKLNVHVCESYELEEQQRVQQLNASLTSLEESIRHNVEEHILTVVQEWDAKKKGINEIHRTQNAKLDILRQEMELLAQQTQGYFQSPQLLQLIRQLLRMLAQTNQKIENELHHAQNSTLVENRYNGIRRLFREWTQKFEELRQDTNNLRAGYEQLLGDMNRDIPEKFEQIHSVLKELDSLEDTFLKLW